MNWGMNSWVFDLGYLWCVLDWGISGGVLDWGYQWWRLHWGSRGGVLKGRCYSWSFRLGYYWQGARKSEEIELRCLTLWCSNYIFRSLVMDCGICGEVSNRGCSIILGNGEVWD